MSLKRTAAEVAALCIVGLVYIGIWLDETVRSDTVEP